MEEYPCECRSAVSVYGGVAGVVEASQPLQPLDVAALEQTWPTEEEMAGDDVLPGTHRRRVRVPKDVGDYERAWLESDTDGSQNDSAGEDDVNTDSEMQAEEEVIAGRQACSILRCSKNRHSTHFFLPAPPWVGCWLRVYAATMFAVAYASPISADNDSSHAGAPDGADDDWKPLNDTEQQQMKADK